MAKLRLEPYIRDREHESMPRDQLRALQSERLVAGVRRAYERVPFYRRKFDEAGVHPDDVRSIDDLPKLPFTLKSDLRDNYPFGMFAVPMDEVVRVHASSGTTGKPTVVGYTRRDIDLWAEMIARVMAAIGIRPGHVVQNAYGYGLFTGGLGFHYGAEHLGATVVPVSGGNTKRQLMLMQDFGSAVILCTPSYALLMSEIAAEEGIDLHDLPVAAGVFGAEPWSHQMRADIEARWGIQAYDTYGLSEIIGPGVAHECHLKTGLHIYEDHFIAEVIDPETGVPLPEDEPGELVFTAITKEALPMIRYRTRDRTRLFREPCACGRTLTRMEKVTGRTDDMIIVRGVNVFPSQIESVLLQFDGVEPHYQIVVDRDADQVDDLEVWVEVPEAMQHDEGHLIQLESRLTYEITSTLGIRVQLKLVPTKTIPRSEGKAQRVVDRRQL
ncbi:MAG: phenylacetate--CoA ligase [Ardenticatenaceae bacterium]|nr:phenylacetate--CoA ligase [Ardenticatenaceae bacterium]HBY92805.1 phenylacetate--CoA ligase [Chloroflexota bacterium]